MSRECLQGQKAGSTEECRQAMNHCAKKKKEAGEKAAKEAKDNMAKEAAKKQNKPAPRPEAEPADPKSKSKPYEFVYC